MTNREKDLGVDCIDRAQAQTEIEMNASRYTLAHERGAKGEVEWSDNLIAIDDALDIIRKLPSVTPQEPRWIPVSEKLPEEYNTVIASTDIGVVYPEARYSKEYGWEWAYESGMDYWEETESNVLAWMPLPKPFKTESKE